MLTMLFKTTYLRCHLQPEIAGYSSNKQKMCGLPSTLNTQRHAYYTCTQPPAFGRARTESNLRYGL
ncbi:hypothetical protein PILCRDRAFT_608697 [Piloderma croceum F 1598]|uniref:Uncharacterized protein n=1 Tax=Piloderma croceum (strain F 1598) TaxID=765440 RepID=A0A0C3EYZ3_PILCF|nr:hypothetical protein PILCRDRAFT_608697 [Piloderma croceum F 1598]